MKQLLLLIVLTLLGFQSFSQGPTSRQMVPIIPLTNVERYGIDYEIKDYTFNISDSTLINSIDLNSIEHLRSQTENIEVIDATTGQTIILFFEKKDKKSTHLTQKL